MKRLLLAFLIILMPGCASAPVPTTFTGTCALKPIGSTGEGLMFVFAHCEAAK